MNPVIDNELSLSALPPPVPYPYLPQEQPMVGRKEALIHWAHWLRRESQPDAALLLIEGAAGIGKTAFAQQLLQELRPDFDFCVYGKFHSAPSRVPYLALKQCLRHWLDQLLQLEDQTFERLKQNVVEAVQPQAGLLTSVLEELTPLLGKSTALPLEAKVDPQKERLRFTYYFHKFLMAVYDSGLKTAFFLDDLQWSDLATLRLIQDLLQRYTLPGLVILGAYRPQAETPAGKLIQQLKLNGQAGYLPLPSLPAHELDRLIPAHWTLSPDELQAFREYLLHESGGKPFDALQLLSVIEQEKLIIFGADHLSQIRWQELPRYKQDESIIRLVMREFRELGPHPQRLLHIASCMGFYFSCELLHKLAQLPVADYEAALQDLIRRKMIVRQQEVCYFVHDHYLTAAQAQLSAEEMKNIHTDIALHWMAEGALDTRHPEFFNCVNHLNLSDPERAGVTPAVLVILNLSAAALAKKKAAFDRSLEYYQTVEKLLPQLTDAAEEISLADFMPRQGWLPSPLHPSSLYPIYMLGRAESEFLVQNYLAADQLLNTLFTQVDNRLLRLKAYTLKMKICVATLNIKDAPLMLKDGMGVIESLLRDYDITLPQDDTEYQRLVREAYDELLDILPVHDMARLENWPQVDDQEFQDLIHLIVHSLPIIFFVHIGKSKYLAMRSMLLCLQKGFTPSTPALFASSIWTMAAQSDNYELAYELGMLGLKLVEKDPYRLNWHTVYHLAILNYYNWKHHYRESSAKLDEAYTYSLELGDHNYAIFCYTNARMLDLFRGVPLSQHAYQTDHTKAQMQNINFVSKSHAAYLRYMMGQEAGLLEGNFDFSRLLQQQSKDNFNEIYHFNFVREQLYLHCGDYARAYEAGSVCEKYRVLYEALPIGNEHDFYYSLIQCQMAGERGGMDTDTRTLVENRLGEMRRLAAMGSGNYRHKQLFLEAELARLEQRSLDALSLYEQAIDEAACHAFIHLAALAAERCGAYLLSLEQPRLARLFMTDARRYYQQWEAHAKVRWLEQQYPNLLLSASSMDQTQPRSGTQESLPWELVQSAMGLSQELYVHDLINRVLSISAEQTLASYAGFVLKQPLSWQIVATLDKEGIRMVHQNLPRSSSLLPHKTLTEGLKRSEITYVSRLTEHHDLSDAMYFREKRVLSFMMIPIERHQEILGMLYLENVSPGRVEQKQLLTWFELLRIQTGIALSNAQLFENQRKLNQEIRKQEQKRMETVVETQEKERSRVAAELHDHLGQMLALVKINLSRLEDSLEGQFALYEETCQRLDESCSELRRIAHDMMPPDLEKQPLSEILDNLFRKSLTPAGLSYRFPLVQVPERLSVAVKFNLYRIAQEIIHNIIKHAQATNVTIDLTTEDGKLHMMIVDNGKGFDTQFKTDGLGLRSLHNRASMLNGRLDIDSGEQRGSVFHIHIPLLDHETL